VRVKVVLYSLLRDRLPPEARGRAELELPDNSPAAAVFERLHLPAGVAWALNGSIERDASIALKDGDELQFFRVGAGGKG
jgi:hypothetical protein